VTFTTVDIERFLDDGMFREDAFLAGVDAHDWAQYNRARVLVRGCGSAIVPPWAYMVIATRLVGHAKSIRFGNEHDHVVVHRAKPAGDRQPDGPADGPANETTGQRT
jgi:hypothetical protein